VRGPTSMPSIALTSSVIAEASTKFTTSLLHFFKELMTLEQDY